MSAAAALIAWRGCGSELTQPTRALPTRQDFTLEELLDDEDVLQECRNQNNKLVAFLSQEESVKKLLAYVTNEPQGSPDDRMRFKYPNVASELLTTDSPGILDVICTMESLDLIWGVLDQPAPLNPLIAR